MASQDGGGGKVDALGWFVGVPAKEISRGKGGRIWTGVRDGSCEGRR